MSRKSQLTTAMRELTRLEQQVMQVVWEKGRVTAKQVKEALDPTRPLALTTILTVLARLKEKKYVKEVPSLGRSAVFRAIVPKQAVVQQTLKRVLKQFFSGSPSALMAHLLKNEATSDEELQEIRQMLKAKMKRDSREKGGE